MGLVWRTFNNRNHEKIIITLSMFIKIVVCQVDSGTLSGAIGPFSGKGECGGKQEPKGAPP